MFDHGDAIAEDVLIDLFSGAVRYCAATLYRDGSYRESGSPCAPDIDVANRIGAAMLGAAEAFTAAAGRFWLLCELAARAARHVDATGPLWRSAPFRILGARSGRIDPETERRPEDADPANELREDWDFDRAESRRGVLEPDATLLGVHAVTGREVAILIEYDRTRRATKLTSKLARYDHFVTHGWRRTRYARLRHEPTTLFVTRDERHIPNGLREADRQLEASIGEFPGELHRHYTGREEIAFTSRERLLAGDPRVTQVSHRPQRTPAVAQAAAWPKRKQPQYGEVNLPLHELWAPRGEILD